MAYIVMAQCALVNLYGEPVTCPAACASLNSPGYAHIRQGRGPSFAGSYLPGGSPIVMS